MRLCVCIPCQPCVSDSDMTLGEGPAQVRLKGAKTKPCCDCNRYDTTVFRSVHGEAAAGMHRATLVNEAVGCSKATRKLVRHKRRSGVVLGGLGSVDGLQGTVTGSQAYSIRLPAKNALPPEVWFAATIFEMIAYPYHKMRVEAYHDPFDIHGGAPCGMEMTR